MQLVLPVLAACLLGSSHALLGGTRRGASRGGGCAASVDRVENESAPVAAGTTLVAASAAGSASTSLRTNALKLSLSTWPIRSSAECTPGTVRTRTQPASKAAGLL